jgi:uncharacterized repeat protein (TIGR03803 family)
VVFRQTIWIATPLALAMALCAAENPALAQSWPPTPLSETTLYTFSGADGSVPQYVTLSADSRGALYGTTFQGGGQLKGSVFRLTPPALGKSQWSATVLHSFVGTDGAFPHGGLTMDTGGVLYGVTGGGGANGLGVAFKLAPRVWPVNVPGDFTRIYEFTQAVGQTPIGAPIFDGAGALLGAAYAGGANGKGSIYKLTPPKSGTKWTGTALFNFTGGADGANPYATLVADTSGALYGTASAGANNDQGVVFKLSSPDVDCFPVSPNLWCETVLYTFSGAGDGGQPYAGLTMDSSGILYGTTRNGGNLDKGVVFSLTPPVPPSTQWQQTVLYSFSGGQDGANPVSPLTLLGGAFYGVTYAGGGTGCGGAGCGTLFQLTPPSAPAMKWTMKTLYRFTGAADGGAPMGGLTVSAIRFGLGSVIYGVTSSGASGNGTIFTLQCAHQVREIFGGDQHLLCAP